VTFGKKGVINTQKGFSQPKKVIKEKPTYTVIRQKKWSHKPLFSL